MSARTAYTRPDPRQLREQIQQADALTFVCNAATSTVHVALPGLGLWSLPGRDVFPMADDAQAQLLAENLAVGYTATLCGYLACEYRPGVGFRDGDYTVTIFPDHRLCQRCRTLLGEQSDRAYEHDQPAPGNDW